MLIPFLIKLLYYLNYVLFLFIIVLPALIAFVNQIGVVYSGVKQVQNEEKKNNEMLEELCELGATEPENGIQVLSVIGQVEG